MMEGESEVVQEAVIDQAADIGALSVLCATLQAEHEKLRDEFNAHVESNRSDFSAIDSRMNDHIERIGHAHTRMDELVSDLEDVADEVDAAAEAAEIAAEVAMEAAETTDEEIETTPAASVEEAVAEEPQPPEENKPQRRKREFVSLWKRG